MLCNNVGVLRPHVQLLLLLLHKKRAFWAAWGTGLEDASEARGRRRHGESDGFGKKDLRPMLLVFSLVFRCALAYRRLALCPKRYYYSL